MSLQLPYFILDTNTNYIVFQLVWLIPILTSFCEDLFLSTCYLPFLESFYYLYLVELSSQLQPHTSILCLFLFAEL